MRSIFFYGLLMSSSRKIYRFVEKLRKQDNLDEFAVNALKSFDKQMKAAKVAVAICFILFVIVIMNSFGNLADYNFMSKRIGTVVDNKIRYVQNEMVYKDFEELGLDEYKDVQDGEKFILFFDANDSYVRGISQVDYDKLQYNAFCSILVSIVIVILFMLIFTIISRKTFGRDFNNYYALAMKKLRDSSWNGEKAVVYEKNYLVKKRTLFSECVFDFACLLFVFALSGAIVLAVGEIFSLIPNREFVWYSRIIGILLIVFTIVLMIIVNKVYHNRIKVIYSDFSDLDSTKLLMKNENGQVGYYSELGSWINLVRFEIVAEDDKMLRVRCLYKDLNTGFEFKAINCILKDDFIINDIMLLGEKSKNMDKGYMSILLGIIIIYIFIIFFSLYLVKVRDRNTINFRDNQFFVNNFLCDNIF